jgi:hypothetical protein
MQERRTEVAVLGESPVGVAMRWGPLALVALLAACAVGPVANTAEEVAGDYRFTVGPDQREQFWLHADYTLVWERHSNGELKERGLGRWGLVASDVLVDLPGFSFAMRGKAGRLAIRRFQDRVYLVRHSDLGWFDAHGPMDEFCLAQDGAPLVDPPSMWRPGRAVDRAIVTVAMPR